MYSRLRLSLAVWLQGKPDRSQSGYIQHACSYHRVRKSPTICYCARSHSWLQWLIATQPLAKEATVSTTAITLERRLWVRLISKQVLADYMRFRNETNRSLAEKCPTNVKRAIIGHLRSGVRNTCSPTTASAIEKALNAPPGSLFVPEVANGYQVTGRSAA